MSNLGKGHWTIVMRVLRYFCVTADLAIYYQRKVSSYRVLDVHGFVDVDSVGVLDHRRSTIGYVFNLFGGAISWMSKK